MRWKAIIPFVFLIVAVTLSGVFFLDNIIKQAAIYQLTNVFEARVEIESSQMSFSPFGIKFHHVTVADKDQPMQNLFEIEELAAHLQVGPLLKKKVVVDNVTVSGFKRSTKRTHSGALNASSEDANDTQADSLGESKESSPLFDFDDITQQLDVEKLVDKESLRSVQMSHSIKGKIKEKQDSIKKLAEVEDIQKKIESLKSKLNLLQSDIRNISGSNPKPLEIIAHIQQKVKDLKSIKKENKKIIDIIRKKREIFKQEKKDLEDQIAEIRTAADQDFNSILNTIKVDNFKKGNFSETIFSKPIQENAAQVIKWFKYLEKFKSKKGSSAREDNKSQRIEGITVDIPTKTSPLPGLWIKNIKISGNDGVSEIKSEIEHFSTNQEITQKPTSFVYSQSLVGQAKLNINGIFDALSTPKTTAKIRLDKYNIDQKSHKGMFPEVIQSSQLNIESDIMLLQDQFDSTTVIEAKNLILHSDKSVLKVLLSRIREVSIKIKTKGTLSHPRLMVSSDLDGKLAKAFNAHIHSQVDQFKGKLKKQLDSVVNNATSSSQSLLGDYSKEAESALGDLFRGTEGISSLTSKSQSDLKSQEEDSQKTIKKEKTKKLKKRLKKLF